MLSLFRNKLFVNLVWVVVFALAIQAVILAFFSEGISLSISSPLLSSWLPLLHNSPTGQYISIGIAFIISLMIGFGLNSIVNNQEVLYRHSFFPALFFFYLTHLFDTQTLLSPQLLSSGFCLLLIYKYLSLDPRNIKTTPFLDMGFFMACSFCILPESIWFFPALLIALIVAGYLTFKNFLLLLTGISIPIYFLAIGFFLADGDLLRYSEFFTLDFIGLDFSRFQSFNSIDYLVLGFIVFVLLLSVASLQSNLAKNTIRTRRALQLLLLFLLSGIAAMLFSTSPVNQTLTLLALPLAPFLSYYFLKTKRAIWRETLFALFFIILIIARVAVTY